MKKLFAVLAVMAVLVTPNVEAMTCYASYCEFIDTNPGFENPTHGQNWSYDPGVTFTNPNTCGTGWVANLDNTEAIWRFPFVNGTFTSFTLSFNAYLPGSTNNFYDELKITVRNRDTGVEEVTYLHGNSYGGGCTPVTINLSNNYSNRNTMVLFQSGSFSSHVWQIDNVSFKGYY